MATLLILCWCLLLWCFLVHRNAYVQIIYFCTNYIISGCEFTSSLASWLQTFVWDVHLFSFLFLLWVSADYRDMYQTCFSSQLAFGAYNFQFPCWWIILLTVLITSGQRNWRWLVHADGRSPTKDNSAVLIWSYWGFQLEVVNCSSTTMRPLLEKSQIFFHHRLIKMSAL